MNNLNWNRVVNLLRYDYKMEQKRVGSALLVILGVIAGLALLRVFGGSAPNDIAHSMNQNLGIGMLAMIFVLTKIIQTKFTDPRSSVAYQTLPGSPLEKYLVLLTDFAAGFLCLALLYIPLFYLIMLIGNLIHPEGLWLINIFHPQDMQDAMQTTFTSVQIEGQDMSSFSTAIDSLMVNKWLYSLAGWFMKLLLLLVYMMLNLHYRTGSQLKSVGVIIGALMVLSFIPSCGTLSYLISDPDSIIERMNSLLTAIKVLCCLLPFVDAALFYALYRQLKTREAK